MTIVFLYMSNGSNNTRSHQATPSFRLSKEEKTQDITLEDRRLAKAFIAYVDVALHVIWMRGHSQVLQC